MYRIWLEQALPPEYAALLGKDAQVIGSARTTPSTPLIALPKAQGVIAGPAIRYDGAFMDQAPELQVIARTGVGVDNIVIPDATARGIVVCNTPDAPTTSTAELTMALMLAAVKRLKQGQHQLKEGEPRDYFATYEGIQLEGRTLGIVGVGRIGQRVAKLAQAFGMRVIGYSRSFTDEQATKLGIERAPDLDTLLQTADIVSLHMPYSPQTRHLMNADAFAQMKKGAYFINAARGGLVDESALIAALDSGRLGGAGLDVYDPEPPREDNPLLHRSNVIASPHIGGANDASRRRLWSDAITQALQVLNGERPPHVLNPQVLDSKK